MINKKIKFILLPITILYGIIIYFRNLFFEIGLIKSHSFDIPTISIGNIQLGGTGKTPHTEYLINLLKTKYNIAVLSRGYKRESKGFYMLNENSKVSQSGDEPLQIKKKFPEITVAVDKNRKEGIEKIIKNNKKINLILLDDAFQHRFITPEINILLFDYNNLNKKQYLLPIGRLREPISSKRRADIIIITKCPSNLNPIEKRIISNNLELTSKQNLFFSEIKYKENIYSINDREYTLNIQGEGKESSVLCITGIANPKPLLEYIEPKTKELESINFSDHHKFTKTDIEKIKNSYNKLTGKKYILTTEKDASRIKSNSLFTDLEPFIFVIGIDIKIDNESEFIKQIKKGCTH